MSAATAARAAAAVRGRGGIARSTTLQREGVPKRSIQEAVELRLLRRFRRLWVATPDVDPSLLAAATGGGVVSCVSRARGLGLWTRDTESQHFAVAPHANAVRLQGVVHRARPIVARHPDSLVDPIENVLALVAACVPFEDAVAIWDSALDSGLTDKPSLLRLPFRGLARAVLAECSPIRDSGLETYVDIRLRWLGVHIVPQAWILGHRVDFLIGDRLVLQIDGGHHVGAQRARDIAHDAELTLRGYHVIRVGYDDVVNRWPAIQDLIVRAIAQGLHLAR